jgi:hypothetical protein
VDTSCFGDFPTAIGNEINGSKELDVAIYPNPFSVVTTITLGKEVHNATFSLYSLLGEK